MKFISKFITAGACLLALNSFGQLTVETDGNVKVSENFNNGHYVSHTGKYGQANGFDLHPYPTSDYRKSLVIEAGRSESAGLALNGDYAMIWSPGDYGRLLRILDEDFMGSNGLDYAEKAYIDGSGNYFQVSDARHKKDIATLSSSLDKVKNLRGVEYNFKNESLDKEKKEDKAKKDLEIGFIAQEVKTIIPEAVQSNESGYMFVNYTAIIPYLVEAIKEQQDAIEAQAERIAELEGDLASCCEAQASADAKTTDAEGVAASLAQNNPNPFGTETQIEMTIPTEAGSATLYVYDWQGNQKVSVDVKERGTSTVTISGKKLDAGMYIYTLIVDGKVIGSKQMIITE